MINKYLKIIIVLLLVANATFAGNKIGIYDLRYTLQADLSTAQGLNLLGMMYMLWLLCKEW